MDEKRAVDVVMREIKTYGSIKISFDKEINFQRDGEKGPNGEINLERMTHFFKGKPFVVTKATTRSEVVDNYRKTMGDIQGQMEAWDDGGSGWDVSSVESGYVNTARYTPVAGSSFIPLPPELAAKKAIVNVQNRDNECLKWALKSALFPVGNHAERTSKYPKNDGLNWDGIKFPTKVSQIGKLERQNRNLAVNVWGWENKDLIILHSSTKPKEVKRIELMLITDGEKSHYC